MLAKVFEKPIELSVEEVESVLLQMAAGTVDDYGWDNFLNIPIRDKRLDTIREKVEILWSYDDFLTKNNDGDYILNSKGLKELEVIISELHSVQHT